MMPNNKGDALFQQPYAKNIQGTLCVILSLHKIFAVIPFNLKTYKFQVIPFLLMTVLIYAMIYMYLIIIDVKKEVKSRHLNSLLELQGSIEKH